ncbi:unnamed protein product [Strongylus vulgaris]|uniref:Uncharacterized protein n=1 Tax=Strongylus vulgaris TaxID=40348 RepID=A0A3P7JSW5_STRVU|nr:unnamed protein product [Strongylus vulgaris]
MPLFKVVTLGYESRNVCDMDASMLLVSQRHGHRNCGHRSLHGQEQFIGFLPVIDDFEGRRRDHDRNDDDEHDYMDSVTWI